MTTHHPHALYRFYDHSGSLLYVGITVNLPARLTRHRDDKPWWTDVARIDVEPHPDRESVLTAERSAIQAERPRYNVMHNTGNPNAATTRTRKPEIYEPTDQWVFTNRRSGYQKTSNMYLYWEVSGDPISDNFYTDEVSAYDLWRIWLDRTEPDEDVTTFFGDNAVAIHWSVQGDGGLGSECAPFRDLRPITRYLQREHPSSLKPDNRGYRNFLVESFLTYYTWPVNAKTGEPLNWLTLPVIDKVWRDDNLPELYTTKGGFIQEITGWKPSPFQPYVNIRHLAQAAGLPHP